MASKDAAKFGRRAKNTGWGDSEDANASPQAFGGSDVVNEGKQPRFKETNVTDIQEIPDLDVNDESDIKRQVAAAPNVRVQRVQSLKELDQDIMYQIPNSMQDGVDLSMLTSTLVPQAKTIEEDEPWTFDQLFTALSSEMRKEDEKKKKAKEIKGKILSSTQ
mmetsp:Transcript_2983/g.4317  ORF Transcript_2983/g.4317 Transcript_2983/m.4317 type:complete len:162 (+) Transcript_2983:50-535(+)